MKTKSESRTKRVLVSLWNVPRWLDLERLRAGKQYILSTVQRLFSAEKAEKSESFKAAKARLNLTDSAITERGKALLRLSVVMLGMAAVVFCYMIYQLVQAHFLAAILTGVVMLLALSLAFRYHFWYFQIEQQKLGCSFAEWFKQGLMGANDE